MICKALKCLKPKMSCGPDGIPTYFLKKLTNSIKYPLSLLFTFSMNTGEIPHIWKLSNVVPVPKKEQPKNEVGSYRPISKQSSVLKLMEKVMVMQLLQYLNNNALLHERQFGFRPQRSVTDQLLVCLDDWTQMYKTGTDVVFLDFRKAFDSVSHTKLLHKFRSYGIGGRLHDWIKSYLSGRFQRVQIDDNYSEYAPITSGILQGSVAGPILFLLYINDLPDHLTDVNTALFADDVKLYSTDPALIHASLREIEAWCKTWQLKLTANKCTTIRIASRRILPPIPFMLNGLILNSVESQRDLGVIISHKLDFAEHYSAIIAKANDAAYLILKCFESKRPITMATAFTAYVRPILESFVQVWNPYRLSDSKRIESVQRSFTRNVYKKCGLLMQPYEGRMVFLNLFQLAPRRTYLDLSLAYKYFQHPQPATALLLRRQTRTLRNSNNKLTFENNATGPRKHFFTNRIVRPWNELNLNPIPEEKQSFKTKTKAHLNLK